MNLKNVWRSGMKRFHSVLQKSQPSTEDAASGEEASSSSPSVNTSTYEVSPQHRIISGKYISRAALRPIQLVEDELAIAVREHESITAEFVSKRDNLLDIETDVKAELVRHYEPLMLTALKQRERLQTEFDLNEVNTLYPVVDLEFLRQLKGGRHGIKLPNYAIFDAEHATMKVQGTVYEAASEFGSKFRPSIAPNLANDFLDFAQLEKFGKDYLQKYSNERLFSISVAVAAQFTHILPDEVRRFCKQGLSVFDQIFFVTEAPDWIALLSWNGLPMSVPNRKMSVIARKGKTCWLIAETEAR